ncbi:MAG: flagellar biosynthetic protein FliR [Myxococcota bacterium]
MLELAPYGFALARVSGLIAGLPMLTSEVAPFQVRGVAAIVLTLSIGGTLPAASFATVEPSLLVLEFLLGLAMGLTVRVLAATVSIAGEVIGMQMGIGFQQLVDPMTQQMKGALSSIFDSVFAVLLFVTGAYRELFRALRASYSIHPMGEVTGIGEIARALADLAASSFAHGLRIGLPLVAVACASQLTFGLLTRVAPQLNVWSLGFLVTIGAGIFAISFFAPVVVRELAWLLSESIDSSLAIIEGGR